MGMNESEMSRLRPESLPVSGTARVFPDMYIRRGAGDLNVSSLLSMTLSIPLSMPVPVNFMSDAIRSAVIRLMPYAGMPYVPDARMRARGPSERSVLRALFPA